MLVIKNIRSFVHTSVKHSMTRKQDLFYLCTFVYCVYSSENFYIFCLCVCQVGVSEIKGRCSYHFNVVVIICDTFLSFWYKSLTGISFIHKCVCFDYNSFQIIPDFEQWGFILCNLLWTKYKLRFIMYSTHIQQHHVCACCGAKHPAFVNLHSTKLFSFFSIFTLLDKIKFQNFSVICGMILIYCIPILQVKSYVCRFLAIFLF